MTAAKKSTKKAPAKGKRAEREPANPRSPRAKRKDDGGAEEGSAEAQESSEGDDLEFREPEGDLDDGADVDAQIAPKIAKKAAKAAGDAGLATFDPMTAYLREVQRHPLLTPDETLRIASEFAKTQDPALAARLVTSNLRLVVKIAYEYRRAYRNIMDLVQEGNIGLMQAVKRYDPYRGVKLSSYAAWWIRAYILRFILNNWRLVKLGTTQAQRKLFFNLRKARAELQARGVDPSHEDIALHLGVSEQDVAEMDVRLASSERSLDAPVFDGEGRSMSRADLLPTTSDGPEVLMAAGELHHIVQEKLAIFRKTLLTKEKELAIFDDRLVADEPMTLQELGDRFGVSRERVRQLEQRVTTRLREYLKAEMGDVVEAP